MRFIKIDENGVVVSIRYGNEKTTSEIESDVGDLGQIMQSDGTFINQEPIVDETLTTDERIQQLQQDNLILMDALASVYEELLTIKTGGTV